MAKQTNSIAPDINVSSKALSEYEKHLSQTKVLLEKVSKATGGATGSIATLNAQLKKQSKDLGMSNSQVQKLAKSMGVLEVRNNRNGMALSVFRSKLLMFNFTIGLAAKFTSDLVKAFGEQERAEKQVTQSLISTKHASGQTTESIKAYANEMQKATGIGDEMILGSAALLNTFTNIGGDVFPQAQTAILDVASAMYQGNVTMEALKTTTQQVGKALNSPLDGMSALGRVGIQFTATQKNMIKQMSAVGNIAGAQAIILGELKTQFEGSATNGDNANKSFRAFSAGMSDFQQRIGGAIAPAFEKLIGLTTDFINSLSPARILAFITSMVSMATAFKVYTNRVILAKGATLAYSRVMLVLTGRVKALTLATRIFTSSTGIGALITGFSLLAAWGLTSAAGIGEATQALDDLEGGTTPVKNNMDALRAKLARAESAQTLFNSTLTDGTASQDKHKKALDAVGAATAGFSFDRNANKKLGDAWVITQTAVVKGINDEIAALEKRQAGEASGTAPDPKVKQMDAPTLKLYNKYLNLGEKQATLNGHIKDNVFWVKEASIYQKELSKAAAQWAGGDAEKLKETWPEITDAIKAWADEAEKAIEIKKRMQAVDALQANVTAFLVQDNNAYISSLESRKDRDIALTKETSEYKLAQKRGDTKKMAALEKAAAKKSLDDRKKAFRAKQLIAISNITIDFLQAVAKDTATTGIAGFISSNIMYSLATAASIATIMAQKAPAYAKGGDFVTSGPQMIQVGDNPGGRERVSVTPLSSPNFEGPQGGSVNISFSGNVMSQDFIEDEAIPMIKEAIRRGADIGVA